MTGRGGRLFVVRVLRDAAERERVGAHSTYCSPRKNAMFSHQSFSNGRRAWAART
jgi:hypothetical protein